MKIVLAATGHRASAEAKRILAVYPDAVVLGSSHAQAPAPAFGAHNDGLIAKIRACGLLPSETSPVVLLDSDLIPVGADPLAEFDAPDVDVAFVKYPATVHAAESAVAAAYGALGGMPNTGFVVFRNGGVAADFAADWETTLTARLAAPPSVDKNDECAFAIALAASSLTFTTLDPIWNNWSFSGSGFIVPEGSCKFLHRHATDAELEILAREPEPEVVPAMISAWQAVAAMRETPYGEGTLYEAVEAEIQAIPDGPVKIDIVAAWERNANFMRDSTTILGIAAALGLTPEQVDDLFVRGGSKTV